MGRFGNLNCDMTSTRIPNFYSLFSGCGGLDLGFVQAGFVPRLSVDQDANALAVHSAHLACPVQKLDLAASDPSIPQSARIDVLLAGSPCQGFSTLGQRRVDDPGIRSCSWLLDWRQSTARRLWLQRTCWAHCLESIDSIGRRCILRCAPWGIRPKTFISIALILG